MNADTITIGAIVANARAALSESVKLATYAEQLDRLATMARDGSISPEEAVKSIRQLCERTGMKFDDQKGSN